MPMAQAENSTTDDLTVAKNKLYHLADEIETAAEMCYLSEELGTTLDQMSDRSTRMVTHL